MQKYTLKNKLSPKTHLIATGVILACGAISPQAQAAMTKGSILKFSPGVVTYIGSASSPIAIVKSGSYFGMDTNGGGIKPSERTAITANAGLVVGSSQTASGSHSGKPGTSTTTEHPGIDKPWNFFGNTGMHYAKTATTILSASGKTATLDFSGWGVTWNKISAIDMGQKAWQAGTTSSVANVTCGVDCGNGDTFTLDYSATVPLGDPSGFGGVPYNLHLEGTISVPGSLTSSSGTTLAAGSYATKAGSTDGRVSMADLTSTGGIKADTGFAYGGSLYDFTITSVTAASAQIVIPLNAAIPVNAVYREYINGAWTTFTADATNLIASAAKVSGACPVVGNAAYDPAKGLVAGNECLQLTIEDNGPYDSDTTIGTISDPGGVATAVVASVDTRTWGTSGCSMSQNPVDPTQRADWWLVAGFFAGLAWLRRKRHAK